MGGLFAFLGKWLMGGGLSGLADQVRRTYELKLNAQNSHDRLAADLDLKRIEAAMYAMKAANDDRWSATSIGRYLIVIPFGLWYALIMADSIFAFSWDVLALPPQVMALSTWLFPAIIVGDVGKTIFRRR